MTLWRSIVAIFGGAIGLIGGYFVSVFIGIAIFPDSNLAPLPFLCCLWPLITVAAVAASLYVTIPRNMRSGESTDNQNCPECGYDLRGNLENEPGCPECGWGRGAAE